MVSKEQEMSSRSSILNSIKAITLEEKALPELPSFGISEEIETAFKKYIGGFAVHKVRLGITFVPKLFHWMLSLPSFKTKLRQKVQNE